MKIPDSGWFCARPVQQIIEDCSGGHPEFPLPYTIRPCLGVLKTIKKKICFLHQR